MSRLDPELLELPEIIPILDDLFYTNEELTSLLNKNWKFLNKEDKDKNKIFIITTETKQSILNILSYCKKVDSLKQKYYKKIKGGIINNDTINDFKILNNKFFNLIIGYTSPLESFRDKLKLVNILSKEEKAEIDKSLFYDLYEIMNTENNIINLVTLALENNISSAQKDLYTSEMTSINYNKTKIELVYSDKMGLSLKSNTKLLYKPRKGTDRFYYLKELINNDGKILSRKHLDKKSKKKKKDNSNQNIVTSHSLSDMNRIIKRKLKLEYDFILGNGYRINTENYKIEINN